jgi:hypothetical protein
MLNNESYTFAMRKKDKYWDDKGNGFYYYWFKMKI